MPEPVSPADTIQRAREHAGYDSMPEVLREPFLALADLADALLAVGERDRAERDAAVREAGVWQRDRNVQVAALTEAGERDRRQIARLTEALADIRAEFGPRAVLADEEDARP